MSVINTAEPVVVEADEDVRERLMWVGPDDRGLDLEVIAIVEPAKIPVRVRKLRG